MIHKGKIGQYVLRALSVAALAAGISPIYAGSGPQEQPEPTAQTYTQMPLENDPIATRSGPMTSSDIQSLKNLARGKGYTFTIGPNPATLRPMHELCGLIVPTPNQLWAEQSTSPAVTVLSGLPAQFDWRQLGGNVTVRNQGGCGSCWAFGTVGPLECNIKIKDGVEVDLSEQYLVSCNTNGHSCSGGWFVHDMHVNPGAVMESCFPYQASNVSCKTGCAHPYRLESWGSVANDVATLKSAIYQYGPISTTVAADSYFCAYTSGVFNRNSSTSVNHAVVLVGWDDSTQSWILRNSWGSGWGEGGYMRITYNCNKVGNGSSYVVYKGGNPPPPPPDGGPAGYTRCANEGGSYTFTTRVDVAYGSNGKYNYKYGVTGTIAFNNGTFGDPIPGVVKSGFYKAGSTTPPGYTKCANEGGSYTLPGLCDVAYGANGKYNYKFGFTGTIAFNNGTFGDPIPGVVKAGFYKTGSAVLGTFVRQPATNTWHTGVIEMVSGALRWRNTAGVSWPLTSDLANNRLLTNSQCPYYSTTGGNAFTLVTKQNSDGSIGISGFQFLGELYTKQ